MRRIWTKTNDKMISRFLQQNWPMLTQLLFSFFSKFWRFFCWWWRWRRLTHFHKNNLTKWLPLNTYHKLTRLAVVMSCDVFALNKLNLNMGPITRHLKTSPKRVEKCSNKFVETVKRKQLISFEKVPCIVTTSSLVEDGVKVPHWSTIKLFCFMYL